MQSRVSLAEVLDADVPIRPDEAVAILREVCRQFAAGDLHGIPNPTVIRLTREGKIAVEGPVSRDQAAVPAAAALLAELLQGFQTTRGFRVPGGLRLVLARATRTLDLPPFADVQEFCAALERFAAPQPANSVRRLFAAWRARQQPTRSDGGDLTISDVRRARRATGLSLEELAPVCGIDAARLRELEWGYMRHWRADHEGREALRRYARAAGLDEDLVLSVALPVIENQEPVIAEATVVEEVEEPSPAPSASSGSELALVPAVPDVIAPLAWRAKPSTPFFERHRWAVALVAAILLAIVGIGTGWEHPVRPIAASAAPAVPEREAVVANSVPSDEVTRDEADDVRPATLITTPAPRAHEAKAKPVQKARAPRPQPARKSFFKRELFRIVIK